MPALRAAEEAVKLINKNQIDYIKALKSPPVVIKNVLRALCLVLYPNPKETKKAEDGITNTIDWWAASLKLLTRPALVNDMTGLDIDALEEKQVKNLGAFLENPEFKETLELKKVENASEACKYMMMWINGVYNFYFVNKRVKPKKIALAES